MARACSANPAGCGSVVLTVEGSRCNVYATSPEQPRPAIVFSTHMDNVPPFIPSSEDAARVYGRGSCDAKGIIATQIAAAERLREASIHVGLLFLVGEERDSLGAKIANQQSPGCRFLVNGEPTENRIATASKGTLRVNVIAEGRMAHSAYPELGESAIDKLLEALKAGFDANGVDSDNADVKKVLAAIQAGPSWRILTLTTWPAT